MPVIGQIAPEAEAGLPGSGSRLRKSLPAASSTGLSQHHCKSMDGCRSNLKRLSWWQMRKTHLSPSPNNHRPRRRLFSVQQQTKRQRLCKPVFAIAIGCASILVVVRVALRRSPFRSLSSNQALPDNGTKKEALNMKNLRKPFPTDSSSLLSKAHYTEHSSLLQNEVLEELSFSSFPDNYQLTKDQIHQAKVLLSQAQSHVLTPIQYPRDYHQYTIRINTWRRNEQLLLSLDHHSKCQGVAQIQIIWCDKDNDPPPAVLNHVSGKIVVEYHTVNSLNERFHILNDTPTLGILSMDDDVLRPCEAIDAGFFRWTDNPERMVGFDTRLHMISPLVNGSNTPATTTSEEGGMEDDDVAATNTAITNGHQESIWDRGGVLASLIATPAIETKWSYGYQSTTKRYNLYSITLSRYAFLHKDYLNLYMTHLPHPIFDVVSSKFNCEDIAMSLFVSALTGGKVPLLADYWAVASLVKLYSPKMISSGTQHKAVRDGCVNLFSSLLGLKDNFEEEKKSLNSEKSEVEKELLPPRPKRPWGKFLPSAAWHRIHTPLTFGALLELDALDGGPLVVRDGMIQRRVELILMLQSWTSSNQQHDSIQNIMDNTRALAERDGKEALRTGLIEKSQEWRDRWHIDNGTGGSSDVGEETANRE